MLIFFLRAVLKPEDPELFKECILMKLFVGESSMTIACSIYIPCSIAAAGEMGPSETIYSLISLDTGLLLAHPPACGPTPLETGV